MVDSLALRSQSRISKATVMAIEWVKAEEDTVTWWLSKLCKHWSWCWQWHLFCIANSSAILQMRWMISMGHPCFWIIKHCICRHEHIAEWISVVVIAVVVGLTVTTTAWTTVRPSHIVQLSSGWGFSGHFWQPDKPHLILCLP